MSQEQIQGPLVIVGGGEERPGAILEEFARLAGGREAGIVLMTLATEDPEEAERSYREAFGKIGVDNVHGLDCRRREDAEDERRIALIRQATGVYFTGGDQKLILRLLHDTPLEEAIRRRRAEGVVIGGTSAGASMMAETMMESGESEQCPRASIVELGRGMDLLPGVIIDQHFAQRGRLGRLLSALALQADKLGLGIGEDTAMIVEGDEFRTIGRGVVTVLDAARLGYNSREVRNPDEPLTLGGVVLHTIADGDRFNLRTRALRPASPAEALASVDGEGGAG